MTLIPFEKRRELAESIRHYVDEGAHDAIRFVYEPGDATHYEFVLARCDTSPLTGACSDEYAWALRPVEMHAGRWVLASAGLKRGGCAMTVDLETGGWIDPTYISEKLDLTHASAVVLAELLNMVVDVDGRFLARLREENPLVFGHEPEAAHD